MPIYEYHCQKCGHQFDTRRSIINTNGPTPCENYGSQETYTISKTFFSHNKSVTKKSTSSGCGSRHGGTCPSYRH